jgi:hypothetical protein
MSQVTAIVDKLLTNDSRLLQNDDSQFIADRFLTVPASPVKEKSGKVGYYGKENLRLENTVMGGRGKAPYIEINSRSSDTYLIDSHGLATIVSQDDYDNVELPYDAEKDAMLELRQKLKLGREYSLASAVTSTGTMTRNTTLSGVDQFSDYTNSDPIGVMQDARASIFDYAGKGMGLRGAMGFKVFEKLRYHPAILENLGFTRQRAGMMTENELATALGLDEVLIGSAVYNSSVKGQSDSLAGVWGKHMVVFHAPLKGGLRQQTLGFSIARAKDAISVYKTAVSNPPGSNEIIVTLGYDDLIADVNCGYLIYNAIA